MGSKTRLCSYCTKRANNGVNLVTSRKINTRLVPPINPYSLNVIVGYFTFGSVNVPNTSKTDLALGVHAKEYHHKFVGVTIAAIIPSRSECSDLKRRNLQKSQSHLTIQGLFRQDASESICRRKIRRAGF